MAGLKQRPDALLAIFRRLTVKKITRWRGRAGRYWRKRLRLPVLGLRRTDAARGVVTLPARSRAIW